MLKNKKAIVWAELTRWILAIALLALVIIFIIISQQSGSNILEKLRRILRFGR